MVAEHARAALQRRICHDFVGSGNLVLDPAALDRLVASLVGLLASVEIRLHLRAILVRRGMLVPVLSHNEVSDEVTVQVAATLRQPQVGVGAARPFAIA